MHYQLGLIGYPIQHSLSPWIHERFLTNTNLSGAYRIMEIHPHEDFSEQVKRIRQSKINGFNVTVPYKQKIIPYLDQIDENARLMGAVNTVVNKNGVWTGYNTDGIGYVRSLRSRFSSLNEKAMKVLLIGAGGAARGIYYALIQADFLHIDITNRTLTSAKEIKALKDSNVYTSIFSLDEIEERLHIYDMIIQTTSIGMKPNENQSIIHLDHIKKGSIVSDIIYQPLQTEFLKQGEKMGAKLHYGHTMLLYQAQAAFELWTNMNPAMEDMDKELIKKLRGDE